MADTPTLAAAAAWYADHKIPVFPCKPRDKAPLTRHGFKDATTDQSRIDSWWRKWPNANIGVPTGVASGLLAVDIDPRNGGDDSLEKLLAKHGPFPDTANQLTGGGGRHIVFRHPGVSVAKALAQGVDLKGEGGYIIVTPSIHSSGRCYQWDGTEGRKALLTPAEVPCWLLERITKAPPAVRRRQPRERPQSSSDGEKWRPGERNNRLTSIGGALRRIGMSSAAVHAALLEENRQRCNPPLDGSEVERIAESLARYPAGSLTAFTPPGYDTDFEAFLDVVRFTADLPGFPVLLFHVERSLGYGKAADRTSLSQVVDGVASRTLNTWIRKGCGRKKNAVVRAHKVLSRPDRPFLKVRHHSSPEQGNEPTEFEVNWGWLAEYIAERKRQPLPPLVSQQDKPLVSQQDTHNHIAAGTGERLKTPIGNSRARREAKTS